MILDFDCICDTNPATTDGPEQDCPKHGDVRLYASWWAQTNDELRRVQGEVDRLQAKLEAQRKATGLAWGAFLNCITDETWEDIEALYPHTMHRLRATLFGER